MQKAKSTKKKGGPVDISKIKPEEMLKYEIARELGLYDKVIENGWRSLTAKESGRIGGIMTGRRLAEQKKKPCAGRGLITAACVERKSVSWEK